MFHPEPFRRWLAGEVEILGLAARENQERTDKVSASVEEMSGNDSEGIKRRR